MLPAVILRPDAPPGERRAASRFVGPLQNDSHRLRLPHAQASQDQPQAARCAAPGRRLSRQNDPAPDVHAGEDRDAVEIRPYPPFERSSWKGCRETFLASAGSPCRIGIIINKRPRKGGVMQTKAQLSRPTGPVRLLLHLVDEALGDEYDDDKNDDGRDYPNCPHGNLHSEKFHHGGYPFVQARRSMRFDSDRLIMVALSHFSRKRASSASLIILRALTRA